MKNKNLVFWIVFYIVAVFIFGIAALYQQIFAAGCELTEIEQINKYYAEQTIKSEIEYAAMWEYVESMSEEEYCNTFFKVQHDK